MFTIKKMEFYGWISFIFCAILYLISGIKNKDYISILGTILFFFGCIFFIITLKKTAKQ